MRINITKTIKIILKISTIIVSISEANSVSFAQSINREQKTVLDYLKSEPYRGLKFKGNQTKVAALQSAPTKVTLLPSGPFQFNGRDSQANSIAENSSAAYSSEIRNADSLNTIVVTGSHIRGINTTVGNQLITIDREQIERQAYATVRDVLEDLPQNFGGGATGERQVGTAASNNIGSGTTVNLRGLGSVATLTLINGRRLPGNGYTADLADISGIPISAIERIEILPDGASAVYGADAVAGVVNFILRKRYQGFETKVRYGAATSTSVDEYLLSQSGGYAWDSGSIIASYEFSHSDRLPRADRSFTASMDMRPLGGLDYRGLAGNPGNILNAEASQILFVIPPNQSGQHLTPDMLLGPRHANITDPAKTSDIFPRQRRHSVYTYIEQEISSSLDGFLEGRFSHRKSNLKMGPWRDLLFVTSDNPFYVDAFGGGQPLFINYSFENELPISTQRSSVEAFSGTVGLDWKHGEDWATSSYFSYAKDQTHLRLEPFISQSRLMEALSNPDPRLAFNPFGHGQINGPEILNSLLVESLVEVDSRIYQSNITTSGPLISLWGNSVRGAFGLEYRVEKFNRMAVTGDFVDPARTKRKVQSIFGELFIPIISDDSPFSSMNRFELSLSARHERFNDWGQTTTVIDPDPQSSTNPRVGALLEPFEGVVLRANYGTSFRAPGLNALTSPPSIIAASLPHPQDPTRSVYGFMLLGAQPYLKNETADTWNIGFELTPKITNGINLKVNYFNIDFKNRVDQPTFDIVRAFLDPAFQNVLIENPSLQEVQAACSSVPVESRSVGAADCTTPGLVQFIYDTRFSNLSRNKIRGIDFDAVLPLETKMAGQFIIRATATYVIDYKQAVTPDSRLVERVNTAGHPVRFKARGSLTWETPVGVVAVADVNYANKYKDDVRDRKINSWTTFDIGVMYSFSEDRYGSFLGGTVVNLTVTNIFNNNPPFYETAFLAYGYDAANADPFGRRLSLSLTKNW